MNQILVIEYWTENHELWVSRICSMSAYWRSGKARA